MFLFLPASANPSNILGENFEAPRIKAAVASVTATTARIAVLTASDRASSGVYEDKSGPAVVEMVPHQTVNVKRKIMARWWFHIFYFQPLVFF